MRIIRAFTGETLVEDEEVDSVEAAIQVASEHLGVSKDLLQVIIVECSVVVLSGKVLCNQCQKKTTCSCGAPAETECQCATLDSVTSSLCRSCEDHYAEQSKWEDEYQMRKDVAALWD